MVTSLLKRLVCGLLILGVSSVGLISCGTKAPRNLLNSIKNGSVILGTKFDQPGLGLRHPNKSFSGFDVAVSTYVVNKIADSLGVSHPSITWRETPSAQRETLIANGEVDMIAATYSINAARSQRVNFAGPYLINYQGLLVASDSPSPITQLADLKQGKKLCSVTGSTPAQNVKAQLPGVQLQEYDTYSSCVEALRRGKVDALTTDEVILSGFANRFAGTMRVIDMTYPHDCVPGKDKKSFKKGAPFSTERYGIGLAKGDTASQTAINEALRSMLLAPKNGHSIWELALRKALGDKAVDAMIERTQTSDKYKLFPTPGDLDFVSKKSQTCAEAAGGA